MSFSKCHAVRKVPYDPNLHFIFDGEEFSRMARFWTKGYDVYSPSRVIVVQLIFDVELEQVLVDENDQGYYDDIPVTQDEVRELVAKTIGKNKPTFTEQKKEDLN